jgi:hypothetical protein
LIATGCNDGVAIREKSIDQHATDAASGAGNYNYSILLHAVLPQRCSCSSDQLAAPSVA